MYYEYVKKYGEPDSYGECESCFQEDVELWEYENVGDRYESGFHIYEGSIDLCGKCRDIAEKQYVNYSFKTYRKGKRRVEK